ncbi:MAG: tetratricopeptide repeat protein [bacterium]
MLRHTLWMVALLAFVVGGCTQSFYSQGRHHLEQGRPQTAVDALYKEIAANPASYQAWRELGVAYYEMEQLDKAEDALLQSNQIRPDARTQLYLGMIAETRDDIPKAIEAYSMSLGLHPRGKTSEMVRVRREQLVARQIQAEAATALANEAAIDVSEIPDHTISVTDFDGSHLPVELAPLAKGLAEFTAVDLSKVPSLTVVERQRLDAVLKELEFTQSRFVDQATAPRVGRLLGSRRLVTGTLLSVGTDELSLDGTVVSTADGGSQRTQTVQGKIQTIFALQKEFVFNLLDDMGIKLTAEQRDEIQEVPTESYLALLAYSRGLDFESRGMPEAAKREYAEAVRLDPGFREAGVRLTQTNLAIGGLAGSGGLSDFGNAVEDQHLLTEAGQGMEDLLGALSNLTGTIPNSAGDLSDIPSIIPPLAGSGTGTIVIRGTIDE